MRKKQTAIIAIITILLFFALASFLVINSYQINEGKKCIYDSSIKKYIGKSYEECSRTQFLCAEGKRFDDECGCGCTIGSAGNTPAEQNFCSPESRNADVCIALYQPVCGWFDSAKIQCIRYPCTQTFSNRCFACMDDKVLYWTDGECPA